MKIPKTPKTAKANVKIESPKGHRMRKDDELSESLSRANTEADHSRTLI